MESLLDVAPPSRRIALTTAPNLPALLGRAALTSRGRSWTDDLPDLAHHRGGVTISPDAVAAYARVCGFPLRSVAPITYLHVLALPVQLTGMVDEAFPLPLPGLVHLENEMTQAGPVPLGATVDVTGWAARRRRHPKGIVFDVFGRVELDGEPVWVGRSTYLAKTSRIGDDVPTGEAPEPLPTPLTGRPSALWKVPADQGRRYAAVSGDVNPIHLSNLAAKVFGFPRAIAHGMWTHARSVAALGPRVGETSTVYARFLKPMPLPSTAVIRVGAVDGGLALDVSRRDDTLLLRTTVTPDVRPGDRL